MLYQIAIELHKTINNYPDLPSTNTVRILDQIVCTRRQNLFQIFKTNQSRIGMNSAENKFYHINNLIPLDALNFTFVHYKKLIKILFLKNGKT